MSDRLTFHAPEIHGPSHGHVDCPTCGDRLYFGTDAIGRTTMRCYTCAVESYLPLNREPPRPKTDRQLPKSDRR